MHRNLIAGLLLILGLLSSPLPAQQASQSGETQQRKWQLTDKLLLDPAIRKGKLENGLTYYIRRNTQPRNRAELRLAVNAGSMMEDDDQKGLAHFLEHMLFNGTKRFEKSALVDFLEGIGLRFGPDLNAYTSFDETVYMLRVPTDKPELLTRAFDVLEDWAGSASLSEEEINKERGVVIEEWRLGQGAQGRLRDKLIPAVFAGSRYKDRLPIGDPEIIRNAPREAFTRFYHDWYRPDLMAVVAVGDFDPEVIEKMIRERFASLKNPEKPRKREEYTLPGHEETIFATITDPELPSSMVQVLYKKEKNEDFETVADYRRLLLRSLFEGAVNARLAEISRRPDAPFLGAGIASSNLVRAGQTYAAQAAAKEGQILPSLEVLLTEVARVREHGLTASEIERQKADLLRSYEQMYQERENTNSQGFAREYVSNFLEGEPAPGIAVEYELARQLVPGITLDELNKAVEAFITKANRVVVVAMPEKAGLVPPTQEQLSKVLNAVEAKDLEAYTDNVVDEPLLSKDLQPATIRSQQKVEALGVTETMLSNGVKILTKPTDFQQEEVLFTAFSDGGTSLVPDDEYLSAAAADAVVNISGLGSFDAVALEKKLAGKSVRVEPSIGEIGEGLDGAAGTLDLETLLQLTHLYFTAPRADQQALDVYKQRQIAALQNLPATPQGVFQKTVLDTMYGDNIRRRIPTIQEVQDINLDAIAKIYKDRFADASDFTFLFVGSFDEAKLLEMCRLYLGSLPTKRRNDGAKETWKNVQPDLPKGIAKGIAIKGTDPQSRVLLNFHGPFTYNRENRFALRMMASVLNIKLREELREDRGGVYGVSVSANASARPREEYTLRISFTCDPERVKELKDAVMEQITWIQNVENMDTYLSKVREQERRSFETSLRENRFWLSTIQFYYQHPNEDPNQLLALPETVNAIGAEQIREAAKKYINTKQYVDVTLYPENFQVPDSPSN
jgi:zinc protease